ncbi:MAG: tetratricopeptide repeat protein, partial [Candidatus Aminicenantales bacterium]
LYVSGKQELALRILEGVLEERADVDIAYKRLAAIHKEAGNIPEALKVLESGLEALPSSYEIFVDYTKTLIAGHRYDRMIQSFQASRFPQAELDPEIWNNLGFAHAQKGEYEQAIRAYEAGLSLDRQHPELHNNLGDALRALGVRNKDTSLIQESLAHFQEAVDLDPTYPAPYFNLGLASAQVGNLDQAIFWWEKTLKVEPRFDQAEINLAMAYFRKGDREKACRLFQDYKRKYYAILPGAQKKKLDAWLARCKD